MSDLAGPIIGLTGAALAVGISAVGIWATSRQAQQGRAAALDQLRISQEHERTMAREARDQDRKAVAYVELLAQLDEALEVTERVIRSMRPLMAAERPSPRLMAVAQAQLSAYASPEVREAFQVAAAEMRAIWERQDELFVIQSQGVPPTDPTGVEAVHRLSRQYLAADHAVDALAVLINAELSAKSDVVASPPAPPV